MPSRESVKTYGRPKKIGGNYISKPVSPLKISEASTAIDALFSKNIRKRNPSFDNKNGLKKGTRGRIRKIKVSETPRLVHSVLKNDSLDVKINSTFDNLLQGPIYNEVNIRNKSFSTLNTSTDTSSSKNIMSEKVQFTYNTRKRNKRHVDKQYKDIIFIDERRNSYVAKLRNKKNYTKKLKQVVANVVINISDTTVDDPDVLKKSHSYLDRSINCSLIIDRQSKQKDKSVNEEPICARKFTSVTSSRQISINRNKQYNFFWHGPTQLMRADNAPRLIHSSTPIIPRNIKENEKLIVSPISRVKSKLNFTANSSKSLFESKTINDISSIPNIVDKNNSVSVPNTNSLNFAESRNIHEISENIITNSRTDLLLPSVQSDTQLVSTAKDKFPAQIITEKEAKNKKCDSEKKCSISSDVKLKSKVLVLLEKCEEELNASYLGVNSKNQLNLISNSSKSLFERESIVDISSIRSDAASCSAITINSTNNHKSNKVSDDVITNDIVNTNFLLPRIQNIPNEKFSTKNIIKLLKSNKSNDAKLNANAVIRLEKFEGIRIGKYMNVVDNISDSEPNFNCHECVGNDFFDQSDRKLNKVIIANIKKTCKSGTNENRNKDLEYDIKYSNNLIRNELVPVVLLEKLSLSKYNNDHVSHNTSKNSFISNESDFIITEISNIKSSYIEKNENNNSKFEICNKYMYTRKVSKKRKTRHSRKSNKSVLINKTINRTKNNYTLDKFTKKRTEEQLEKSINNGENINMNTRSNIFVEQKISVEHNISLSRNSLKKTYSGINRSEITEITELRRSKRLSTKNNHVGIVCFNPKVVSIKYDNTEQTKPKNFITTRRKQLQCNIEPKAHQKSENSDKPLNISMETWTKFSQCQVLLEQINYEENHKSKIKTNIIDDSFKLNASRKSIWLKPGKKWFRSLSVLRRTQIHQIDDQRRPDDNTCEEFKNQQKLKGVYNKFGDENISNDMRNKFGLSNRSIRKSLKIVNLSQRDSIYSIGTEDNTFENKSGYVSTLAHVSILESFDKLSLNKSINDREETARQIILKRCGQTEPFSFDDCYSSRTLKKCRKIGEGVYGEVFMYKSVDNKCKVMKIIPIEGNLVVNGERQKKFEEIISEIIIASELSNLRINNEFCTNGFAELLQIHCLKGKYPQHLLDLWDLYDEERGSENDSPEIFPEDQLYIALELANGGQDLESYRFNSAEQTYVLFVQIICSLAVAESALQFEHRDLHWGNILISSTDEATTTFRLQGREFEVPTKGVKVSIIDFTLSRMTYDNFCIYNDLAADPDLFAATGDYQFDIYRLMKQRNENDWQAYEPYTNILWLDYTLEKMIGHVRYLRANTKTHKSYIRRLSQVRKKILNYNSATELLNSDVFSHVFL